MPRLRFFILLLPTGALLGQPKPEFDVVSVRPTIESPSIKSSQTISGGTYRGANVTLMDLVMNAYSIRPNLILGGFGWIAVDRFDIEAKATGEETLAWDRAKSMLQAVLADRFKLKVHRETREVAAYDLVVAEGGPKFKPNTDPARPFPHFATNIGPSGIHVTATKARMAQLILQLRVSSGRSVVDKTGLAEAYDFKLDWAGDSGPVTVDGSVQTLFTALQQQLGLRLVPSRLVRSVLMIESAERPSVN